jgi:hypothetical protein
MTGSEDVSSISTSTGASVIDFPDRDSGDSDSDNDDDNNGGDNADDDDDDDDDDDEGSPAEGREYDDCGSGCEFAGGESDTIISVDCDIDEWGMYSSEVISSGITLFSFIFISCLIHCIISTIVPRVPIADQEVLRFS